mmetsp:Transcript_11550/g.21334  ORF Transcript_11550/g.21334 Transcript_11550/m.21334 type:complete len:607 (-) Transcript_11550:10-1830(-)
MTRDPRPGTTFSCPICLLENQVIYTTPDSDDNEKPAVQNAVDQSGNPVFELSLCNHQFCAACLRAYVRSKLLDGVFNVPCCHFKLSPMEEDFRPCNAVIQESDIYRLIHMDDDDGQSNNDDWCCKKDNHSESFCSSKATDSNKKENAAGGDQSLWARYQKLKFDAHHGKDSVRRCPKCDDAQLFDEESMKLYQSTFLTQQHQHNIAPTTGGTANNGSNDSTGNMNRLERAFGIFRQRQRDTEVIASAAASHQNVDSNNPSLEEGNIQEKEAPKEDDNELSNGVYPTPPSPIGDKVDACNTQDGESSDGYKNSKSSEANAPSTHEAKQSDSQSLVKSTTPIITCQNCSTEFCYFHSNAHSGKSCVDYHKSNLENDRSNIEYANQILRAKPCPNCGISVSKDGGCNQIKCGSCGTHFCWLCSEIVDDGAFPEHFRWWNLRGCANMQLDENDAPLRCTIWGARALSALQIIVLGIPSLVLTLVCFILCPCLVPGCGRTNRERVVNCVSFWGSFLSSLLLLPFTCLGMLLLSALYCFLASIAFFFKVFKPSAGQGVTSSNLDNAAAAGGNNISRDADASDSGNTTSSQDFIRELENIFDRMEEGRSTSNS